MEGNRKEEREKGVGLGLTDVINKKNNERNKGKREKDSEKERKNEIE
jgi:hypothetical protein